MGFSHQSSPLIRLLPRISVPNQSCLVVLRSPGSPCPQCFHHTSPGNPSISISSLASGHLSHKQRLICLTKDSLHSRDSHPIFFLAFLHFFPPNFFSCPLLPPHISLVYGARLHGAGSCILAGKYNFSPFKGLLQVERGRPGEYQAQICFQPSSTFLLCQFPCCWLCSSQLDLSL